MSVLDKKSFLAFILFFDFSLDDPLAQYVQLDQMLVIEFMALDYLPRLILPMCLPFLCKSPKVSIIFILFEPVGM
jgi:hypothetical protein